MRGALCYFHCQVCVEVAFNCSTLVKPELRRCSWLIMCETSVYLFDSIGAAGVKRRCFSELSLLINDAALCVTRLKLQLFHLFPVITVLLLNFFCFNRVMSMPA